MATKISLQDQTQLQKVVEDSRRLDDLSKQLETLNSEITIHNIEASRKTLAPILAEFQSYTYMDQLPKGSMALQSYEYVKGLINKIPDQLKRLSGIQHRVTVDVAMCGEVTQQDSSTSPSQSLTLNWPGKEQELAQRDLANRASLISVESQDGKRAESPRSRKEIPTVVDPSKKPATGCCVIQ